MKKIIIIALAGLFFAGCSDDLYVFVDRNTDAPVVAAPRLECFKTEREIDVSWDADAAADEYLLYRDTDPLGLFNHLCYRGKKLCYKDSGLESDMRYYYKLAKRRAERIFDKSACVLGAANDIRRDQYEPNDTPDTAAEFYNVTDANIYFYRDNHGNELEDVDWYWVKIEPMRNITFRVWFNDGTNLKPNDIYYAELSGTHYTELSGDNDITIFNYENHECIKYFCIGINKANFDAVGGKMGTYQLIFEETNPNS
jgi:hypothetical protein